MSLVPEQLLLTGQRAKALKPSPRGSDRNDNFPQLERRLPHPLIPPPPLIICSVGPLRFSARCERERVALAPRSRIMLCRFPHSHNDEAMQQPGLATDSCPQGNAPAGFLAGRLSPSRT